ncbi:MAG: hypothetical protein J1E63_01550 [Muribaculaceae bacterium]|nr:hypothetical protein [Muribaculaceae bacterium]
MRKYSKQMLVIAVALIGTVTAVAEEVTLSIRYENTSGFCISQTMDSNDPIDVYIIPYEGHYITKITHYAGERGNVTENVIDSAEIAAANSTEPYHYFRNDDKVKGQNQTLVVSLEKNDNGPTTGVEEAVVDEAFSAVIVSGKTIVVEGAAENELMTVTALNGTTIYTGFGRSVDVAESGVYVVTVGETSTKVLVK